MFDSVPSKIAEEICSKVQEYAIKLVNGETPETNLVLMQKQYTAIVAMNFRKKASAVVAKRLAKNLVSQLFEDIIEDINKSRRF